MKVIVIGGGASGMMAAYAAAQNGNSVILLEKNEKLGKKIYITGKGRCNVTNDCSPQEFLLNVVNGDKFLTGAVYSFPPERTKAFLEENGLKLKTERGRRVFPESDKASDVTKAFERALRLVGVDVIFNSAVKGLEKVGDIFLVKTNNESYTADRVIVCTGGLSYPSTGSTGDGYKIAESFSHTVTPLKPALCGLNIKGDFYKDLQGLTLKNVTLTAAADGKIIYEEMGELLFTHFGVSGPIVLSLSSLLIPYNLSSVILSLDLKPALSKEQLDKRVLRDFEKYKNKDLRNALVELLPSAMIPVIIKRSGLNGEKKVNSVTKEEREKLVETLKNFTLLPYGYRGFEEAIITSGGVDLKEINPKTMESKKCAGLYFCGETLNADAKTGGYNLQIAFSTGFAAGNSIKD